MKEIDCSSKVKIPEFLNYSNKEISSFKFPRKEEVEVSGKLIFYLNETSYEGECYEYIIVAEESDFCRLYIRGYNYASLEKAVRIEQKSLKLLEKALFLARFWKKDYERDEDIDDGWEFSIEYYGEKFEIKSKGYERRPITFDFVYSRIWKLFANL